MYLADLSEQVDVILSFRGVLGVFPVDVQAYRKIISISGNRENIVAMRLTIEAQILDQLDSRGSELRATFLGGRRLGEVGRIGPAADR